MNAPNVRDAIQGIHSLPTLPTVLSQVMATAADAEASAADLGRHIASDQTLSAALLKAVNSAYYGLYRRVDSITTAIVILGFFEVRNLVLAATAFRNFPKGDPDFDRVQLWRHSLATAMTAQRLARAVHIRGGEAAFVCGLLHDIGKVAFDALYPNHFRKAAHTAHAEQRLIRETEVEFLGLDHADAGGLVTEHWNFPPGVVGAVRFHHNPASGGEHARMASVVAVADYLTYQAGVGELSNGRAVEYPAIDPETPIASEEHEAITEELKENRPRIDEFIGSFS